MRNFGEYTLFLVILTFIHGEEDIRLPPYIIKGPKEFIFFRSDGSFTLECKGDGIPDVNYEWKKNGVDLNRNAPNIKSVADGTITIEPATSIDEGYYQCFVRNQYGTALSNTSHIQKAHLDSVSGTLNVYKKTPKEGEPFVIEAQATKSFPKPIYGWELANSAGDNKPVPLIPSSRIQMDDNGNLHFAHAKPEDDLAGRIYKSTTYNQYLDIKAGGSYTKVVVTRVNESQMSAPTLAFSSEHQAVGMIGESVSLRCFFYGNSVPTISWKGPGSTLPLNRWTLGKFNSELSIFNIRASDEGDYICTASNTKGQNSHILQLRVEAKPSFKTASLGPRNINVTVGDDAVFNCDADAIPEAKIVWLQNGNELDVNAPPKKFSFSSDRKTLTIRSVCRNCDDPDKQTDLTVIQCNASNIHGYVFGSGYLNVLESQGDGVSLKPWMIAVIALIATLMLSFLLVFILLRYRHNRHMHSQRQNVEKVIGFRKRASTPKQSLASNYEKIPYDSMFTVQMMPSLAEDPTQPDTTSENTVSREANQFTCLDTMASADDGPCQEPTSSMATMSSHHGNEAPQESEYFGLTGHKISYLTIYSDLTQDDNKHASM